MKTVQAVLVVLAEAEAKLRELVTQAVAQGDYDVAVGAATAARDVAALAVALDGDPPDPRAPCGHAHAISLSGPPAERPISGPAPRTCPGRTARYRRSPPKGKYPKFFRQADHLVKVSWSKKERGEYQHKAARRVVDLLAAAIAGRAAKGRRFTSEDIFPLKNPEAGDEVPSYQAYAALAWFKALGFVRPHGRRGYSAGNPERLLEAVAAAWKELREAPV